MMSNQIFLIAAIIPTLGVMTTGFLNSQVQAVPKICAGNPHDRDSGTNGNPHDLGESGNPHDDHIERVGGGHDPEAGQDTCTGAK
jgi:hypothetical protein